MDVNGVNLTPSDFRATVSEIVLWRRDVARKVTDTVQLKLRFSERLRRQLERAAKHNEWSMNTEIVDRLDVSFQREAQEKEMGGMIEQAVHEAASRTARRLEQVAHSAVTDAARMLVQELRQSGLIPDQNARPLEATQHPTPPDKEERPK
jgi:hypothetical protein